MNTLKRILLITILALFSLTGCKTVHNPPPPRQTTLIVADNHKKDLKDKKEVKKVAPKTNAKPAPVVLVKAEPKLDAKKQKPVAKDTKKVAVPAKDAKKEKVSAKDAAKAKKAKQKNQKPVEENQHKDEIKK